MRSPTVALVSLLLCSLASAPLANELQWRQTKQIARKIWEPKQRSFYCGCTYQQGKIDVTSCAHENDESNPRSKRIEWEHIVPAYKIGKHRPCWTQKICTGHRGTAFKGRKCCARVDKSYQDAAYDLHNLVPAVGSINQERAHFPFYDSPPNTKKSNCNLSIDTLTGRAYPSDELKGMIARIYLYMRDHHKIPLQQPEVIQYRKWHKKFPPNEWELQRDRRIKKAQGNGNPYLEKTD